MDFATFDRRALVRYGPIDLLGMLAMLWIGEIRHGFDPLVYPGVYVQTLVPFLLGWVVAAYALGAYGSRTLGSYRFAIGDALAAWFVANVIGQLIRATPYLRGGSQLSFFLVMLGFVGIALTVGRVVVIAAFGD